MQIAALSSAIMTKYPQAPREAEGAEPASDEGAAAAAGPSAAAAAAAAASNALPDRGPGQPSTSGAPRPHFGLAAAAAAAAGSDARGAGVPIRPSGGSFAEAQALAALAARMSVGGERLKAALAARLLGYVRVLVRWGVWCTQGRAGCSYLDVEDYLRLP